MPRQCINKVDHFCYVCSNLRRSEILNNTSIIKIAYHLYFGVQVRDQD